MAQQPTKPGTKQTPTSVVSGTRKPVPEPVNIATAIYGHLPSSAKPTKEPRK
jgi:hypothetical protein